MEIESCVIAKQLEIDQHIFKRGFYTSDSDDLPFADLGPLSDIKRCARQGCRTCAILEKGITWPVTSENHVFLERKDTLHGGDKIYQTSRLALCTNRGWGRECKKCEFIHIPPEWKYRQSAYLDDERSLINLSQNWIADCLQNHPNCVASETHPLPTRLLHLQAFPESQDIRLVSIDKLHAKTLQYVALSHCWGNLPKRPWLLDENRLEEYKEKISYQDLPLTFRDAVDITRGLGYHYIWIDSLCIVQNNEEDWAREANRMADIYEGAICTICATSGEDSEKGCRVNAGKRSTWKDHLGKILNYADIDTVDGPVRLFDDGPREWYEQYYNIAQSDYHWNTPAEQIGNPLIQRAWAFQERELSPRMLHFSERALLWECASMRASNEVTWTAFKRQVDGTDFRPIRTIGLRHLDSKGDSQPANDWFWLVKDYTSRKLTKEDDKLPAFAGIAARFQSFVPHSQYLAGIWSDHLPWALAWGVDHRWSPFRSYYPREVRSPSWSWASVEGRIGHDAMTKSFSASKAEPASCDLLCKVKAVTCISLHGRIFGAVRPGAQICIEGRVARLRVGDDILNDERRYESDTWRLPCNRIVNSSGIEVGLLFPDVRDWESEPPVIDSLHCLSIGIDPDETCIHHFEVEKLHYGIWEPPREQKVLAIGLVKVEEFDQTSFKRIGLVRWLAKSVFDTVEPSSITIVQSDRNMTHNNRDSESCG